MTNTDNLLLQMDDSLQTLGATQDGAEAHGTLVGLLCAAGHADKKTWLAYITPTLDTSDLLQKEAMKPLVLHDIAEVVEMHESTISRAVSERVEIGLIINHRRTKNIMTTLKQIVPKVRASNSRLSS